MESFASQWCRCHFDYLGYGTDFTSVGLQQWNAGPPPVQSSWPTAPPPAQPSWNPASAAPLDDPSSGPSSEASSRTGGSLEESGPRSSAPEQAEADARAGYLNMLLTTETHRQQREQARRAEHAPPPLQLGSDLDRRRRRELRQLYGAAADRVAALEGRVQLEFERVTDRHRPPLWPNIPLLIRYS